MTLVVKSGITPPSVFILDDCIAFKGGGQAHELISLHSGIEYCTVGLRKGNDARSCLSGEDGQGKEYEYIYKYRLMFHLLLRYGFSQKPVYLQKNCIFKYFL